MKEIIAQPIGRQTVRYSHSSFTAHYWATQEGVAMSTSPEWLGCVWTEAFGANQQECLEQALVDRGICITDVEVGEIEPPVYGSVRINVATDEEKRAYNEAVASCHASHSSHPRDVRIIAACAYMPSQSFACKPIRSR